MKKKIVIIVILALTSIVLLCALYYFFIIFIISYGNNDAILMDEDRTYYENIVESVNKSNSKEIDLKNIFKFDWEMAYIMKSYDGGEDEEFYESVDYASLPIYEEQDGLRCIIFFKNNKEVYEYQYLISNIDFLPRGNFFTSENAVFEVVQKPTWYHEIILKLKV